MFNHNIKEPGLNTSIIPHENRMGYDITAAILQNGGKNVFYTFY